MNVLYSYHSGLSTVILKISIKIKGSAAFATTIDFSESPYYDFSDIGSPERKPPMFCISLNHHNTDLSLREKFSEGPELLEDLSEGVFLSTCNRVEVYGVGDVYLFIENYFHEYKDVLFLYEGDRALRHLYKVAAGLDSMVLGEDEILGQLKQAYESARETGHTGFLMNTAFQGAFTAAKRVKTETLLSKTSVSTATLAASACIRYWDKQQKGLSTDRRGKVLMLGGSGDIGGKLLKDLLSYDRFDIAATVREHGVRQRVKAVDYKDRYEALKEADIVVSATRSPHFTVTAEKVAAVDGGEKKPRFYVDLAVPRDLDPALGDVLTIDDLRELAQHNNDLKRSASEEASVILEEELDSLFKVLTFHELRPLLEAPPKGTPPLTEDWKRVLYAFREEATAEEFRSFCDVLLRLIGDTHKEETP